MRRGSQAGRLFALPAVALALLASSTAAQSASFSESPDTVIVRYSLLLGEMGEAVRGPSLVIYGDGRARIDRPAFMKGHGAHDLRLSRDELTDIVSQLESSGILDTDTRSLRTAVRRAALQEQTGETGPDGIQRIDGVESISDPPITVIEINVVRGSGAAARNVHKQVRWPGLQRDARRHEQIAALQGLAQVEKRLAGLIERAR